MRVESERLRGVERRGNRERELGSNRELSAVAVSTKDQDASIEDLVRSRNTAKGPTFIRMASRFVFEFFFDLGRFSTE